jgi:hypothetical protein
LRIGNNIKVADSRFIKSPYEVLHLQSISYTWDGNTIMFPNFEAVLSGEVISYSNPIKDIRQKIEDANNSVKIIREESLLQAKKTNESINNVNTSIKTFATKESLENNISKLNASIAEQGGLISTVTSVANQAKGDAITALNTLATLTGDGDGSISRQIVDEVAKIITSAPDDLELLREIADFIASDPVRASMIVTTLADHEERLDNIEKENITVLSQSEYDAITNKDANTLYFIYEE